MSTLKLVYLFARFMWVGLLFSGRMPKKKKKKEVECKKKMPFFFFFDGVREPIITRM